MFTIEINSVKTIFSTFFSKDDAIVVSQATKEAKRVIFLDTPSTPNLAMCIKILVDRGQEVIVRDHHRGEGRNPEAAEVVEKLASRLSKIVTRKEAPACASLVHGNECALPKTVIVADPDLDGLSAAMKAAGVHYSGLEKDAEVFDNRTLQHEENLTPLGWKVLKAWNALPALDRKNPHFREEAVWGLFQNFIKCASAYNANNAIDRLARQYDLMVAESHKILDESEEIRPGVTFVDLASKATPYDLNTVTQGLEEAFENVMVTVVRKDTGPIAGMHDGIQYSLAVSKSFQKTLDLRGLVPENSATGLQAGLLSNTSFLLHCSEMVWKETILPNLLTMMSEANKK